MNSKKQMWKPRWCQRNHLSRSSLCVPNTPQHTDAGLNSLAHLHVGAYFASINGCVAHGGWRILFCRC